MPTICATRVRTPLRLLFLGLVLLGIQGCGGSRFIYVIDVVTTRPASPADKPGIWFDAERKTPALPLPTPVKNVHFRLLRHLGEPGAGQPPSIMLSQLYSDTYGCVSMVGEVEMDEGDTFELICERKGYKTMKRRFRPKAVRDASITAVVRALPGTVDPMNPRKPAKKAKESAPATKPAAPPAPPSAAPPAPPSSSPPAVPPAPPPAPPSSSPPAAPPAPPPAPPSSSPPAPAPKPGG